MALYYVSRDATALVAATAKTLVELGTPSNQALRIVDWWVEFDGVSSAAVPVKVEVGRFSAGVTTATTATPDQFDYDQNGPTPLTVYKHTVTAEGAGTASAVENHRISPTSGIRIQYPLGREMTILVSQFFRIRCTAAAAVNATFGVIWEE